MTESSSPPAKYESELIFIEPGSGLEIRAISPSERDTVAAILAPATGAGTVEAATQAIDDLQAADKAALYGGFIRHELVAAYGIRRDGMSNEIPVIAVRADHRRRGIGRALLQDALRRSGKRPLLVETDDEGLPFYKACGFKLFGKRPQPSGRVRYRLGWHAPGVRFKGGSTNALTHKPLDPSSDGST
ncbi:MAG: GNAT family N-acetyltransferase [Chloroflexota bacterium]|nr:GNAT family N-acetyltransferase [Chloroflexia bacterium]MDQ3443713.1 GNAT family N-acetyltransferase [Chloroflexota bacterium]